MTIRKHTANVRDAALYVGVCVAVWATMMLVFSPLHRSVEADRVEAETTIRECSATYWRSR